MATTSRIQLSNDTESPASISLFFQQAKTLRPIISLTTQYDIRRYAKIKTILQQRGFCLLYCQAVSDYSLLVYRQKIYINRAPSKKLE
jgi:hypothetical protein